MHFFCFKTKKFTIKPFRTTKLSEFIQKAKVQDALTKMESDREDLLSSILVRFTNLGDGMKDKIL